VLEQVGEVAYRLALPTGAHIHDVFHVGLLKPFHGDPPAQVPALPPVEHGQVVVQPETVLKAHVARGRRELLVSWTGAPAAETKWVDLEEFVQHFPDYQLENELLLQGGRDVMWGLAYSRRKKNQEGRAPKV
jgi:hypothetical protein